MSNWPSTLFRIGLLCVLLSFIGYPPELMALARVSGVAFLAFSLISAAAELVEAEINRGSASGYRSAFHGS